MRLGPDRPDSRWIFLQIKPSYHWGEITNNVSRLDPTFLMNVLSRDPCGVCVLPSPVNLDGHNPVNPEIVANLLDLMQKMFDFVVIDGPWYELTSRIDLVYVDGRLAFDRA